MFYKIIRFSMQFSAVLNMFIVKTYINSIFTNDLKRKENFSKNVQSYRVCSFELWQLLTSSNNQTLSMGNVSVECLVLMRKVIIFELRVSAKHWYIYRIKTLYDSFIF